MKNLRRQLNQAFNALEFANAGHLTALTALLDSQDSVAIADPGHCSAETGQGASSPATSNSPSL